MVCDESDVDIETRQQMTPRTIIDGSNESTIDEAPTNTDDRCINTNEKVYECRMCAKTFKFKRVLSQHQRQVHSNHRPYNCDVCEKAFKS